MAIHISGKGLVTEIKKCRVQSMPFKIHADCDAKVSEYFDTYVKEKDGGVLCASFRGYPLDGKKIDIPNGYKGVIFHQSLKTNTDKEDRKFYIINSFDSITYWNWNKKPSKNDSFIQALDWIDIAEAVSKSAHSSDGRLNKLKAEIFAYLLPNIFFVNS